MFKKEAPAFFWGGRMSGDNRKFWEGMKGYLWHSQHEGNFIILHIFKCLFGLFSSAQP